MHRKFIAVIIASAIAVTGLSAAPARADETTRLVAGLAALAILGVAAKNHQDRKRDRERAQVTRDHRSDIPVYRDNRNHRGKPDQPRGEIPLHPEWKPQPLPRDLQRYVLPRQCLRELNSYGDRKLVVGAHCMQRNYDYMAQLPRNCWVDAQTHRGRGQGYSYECLRNRGYRLSSN